MRPTRCTAISLHVSSCRVFVMARPENTLFYRTLCASVLFHLAICIILLSWELRSPLRIVQEHVLTVDIRSVEFHETKPVTAPVPVTPRIQRTVLPGRSQAVSRPRPPVARPLPVPIASLESTNERIVPGGKEMSAPTSSVPEVPAATKAERGEPVSAKQIGPASVDTSSVHAKEAVAAAKARYQTVLKILIEKNKDYPLMARKAGREGTCAVRCALERNGSIRRVHIVTSSGHDLLDKSALRAVRSVGQFPPVPVEVKGDEVNFDVPISFSLTGN